MPSYRLFAIFFVCAMLMLAACGGDSDTDNEQDTPQERTESPTGTPAPPTPDPNLPTPLPTYVLPTPEPPDETSWLNNLTPAVTGIFQLPVIENADGRLLLMRGTALFIAGFNGQEAQLLDDSVNPYTLHLSLDSRTLAYVSNVNGLPSIVLMDMASLQVRPLIAVQSSTARVVGWSPDGDWILVSGPGTGELSLFAQDGPASHSIVPPQSTATRFMPDPVAVWLDDSRLLYIDPQALDSESASPMIFDPATGEHTPTNIPLHPAARQDIYPLVEALTEADMQVIGTDTQLFRATRQQPDGQQVWIDWPSAVWNFQPQACDFWQLLRDGEPAYTAANVGYLSDITAVSDGTILFVEWALPGCSLGSYPRVSLKQLKPGEAVRILSEDVLSVANRDLATLPYFHTYKFTLTPDGRYVIWATGNVWTERTTIQIADLLTGQQATLLQSGALSESSLFQNVLWVAD